MGSLFSKIVAGQIPCYKVAENEKFLAFLDINPLAKGHTLVVPKQEIDYIFDIPENLYSEFWQFSKLVGLAIQKSIPCQRIGIAVLGLEVPHAHIHLIPINTVNDINFSRQKLKLSNNELEEIASKIRGNVLF